jgi:hypothetical protein
MFDHRDRLSLSFGSKVGSFVFSREFLTSLIEMTHRAASALNQPTPTSSSR